MGRLQQDLRSLLQAWAFARTQRCWRERPGPGRLHGSGVLGTHTEDSEQIADAGAVPARWRDHRGRRRGDGQRAGSHPLPPETHWHERGLRRGRLREPARFSSAMSRVTRSPGVLSTPAFFSLPMLDGKALMTVESLRGSHPVQRRWWRDTVRNVASARRDL